ncbi:hypothetical protein [Myxococcus sp. Y35]|uniref:hypothetical protein n=1 Tax=Pseudomyxococcus flavus TaxID=3115648 RepID=UPI003CF568AF
MKLVRFAALGLVVALAFAAGVWFSGGQGAAQVPPEAVPAQASATATGTPAPPVSPVARTAPSKAEVPKQAAAIPEAAAPREATVLRRLPDPALDAEAPADEAAAAPEDVPLAFPSELPEAFTPKGFEEVAFRAASECGMGLDVVALDCSEFPCIAWTQAKDDSVTRFSMTDCGPWEAAFQNRTMVVASSQSGEGPSRVRYLAWMPIPQDPGLQRIAMQRARERTDGMKEALGLR